MFLLDIVKDGGRTLMRNKLRSVLTVLGITIGIGAVICVVAIGQAGENLSRLAAWIDENTRSFGRGGTGGQLLSWVWRRQIREPRSLVVLCVLAVLHPLQPEGGRTEVHVAQPIQPAHLRRGRDLPEADERHPDAPLDQAGHEFSCISPDSAQCVGGD